MPKRRRYIINHRLHGALDLLVDITLAGIAAAAWWSGASTPAIVLPGVIGITNLIYSAITSYALGRHHLISFPTHLRLDAVAGIALIIGAVVLPEQPVYRGALLMMGVGILGAVALTDPEVSPST